MELRYVSFSFLTNDVYDCPADGNNTIVAVLRGFCPHNENVVALFFLNPNLG